MEYDGGRDFLGGRCSAQIRRADALLEGSLDAFDQHSGTEMLTEVFEHHGRRPDLTDGIGDSPAGDVR
jgi:hypothetical protein